jgi:hypothetical protein
LFDVVENERPAAEKYDEDVVAQRFCVPSQ